MAKPVPGPREKSSKCSHSKVKKESGPHSFEGPTGPIVAYKWKCDTTKGCNHWFWGNSKGGRL